MFRHYRRNESDVIQAVEVDSAREKIRGADYQASAELENAVNVAITLGRPLLVSGEPGCGKTEFGFSIARKLGISRLHLFSVKSDSEARSLFYTYDAIGRFHAAQIGRAERGEHVAAAQARDFIEYQALGRAILDAHASSDAKRFAAGRYSHPVQPQRSVVIIDEIDKAPRDFPNDLLHEIDQLRFRVPELGSSGGEAETLAKDEIREDLRPIVVITSNSERQLPDAFDVDAAVKIIERARRERLEKLPGTAELLDFVRAVVRHAEDAPSQPAGARFAACLYALAKTEHDARILLGMLPAVA
jgi:MoxR-like ATPase